MKGTNRKHRLLSILLSLMLVAGMMPAMGTTVFAVTPGINLTASTANSSGAGWSYEKDTKTLTLSGYDGDYIKASGIDELNLVLKITATEDQMAIIMDQLEMLGVDVEELEDGMPKAMEELTVPDFDSFVVFDIETTGTNGAASGDGEAKITEIGAVRVVNGEVVEKFDESFGGHRCFVRRTVVME